MSSAATLPKLITTADSTPVAPLLALPSGAQAGELAIGLTNPAGPNLTTEDRAKVERRYRVIEPLVCREKFIELWQQYPRRGQMVDFLARKHATPQRTIYNWLALFNSGGLPALVPHDRNDKGKPRRLNATALDFLLSAALPKPGAYGQLSVLEIFRTYEEERVWRDAHIYKRLELSEVQSYARYLDEEDRLTEQARLPKASVETLRRWFNRIPEVVRTMARNGQDAFHSTQEILSFRDLRR